RYALATGRPAPNDTSVYYEWDTKRKKKGTLPDGTSCCSATCQQIHDCIRKRASTGPDTPKFNPLFNNCRQESKDVLGDCCLKKGKKTNTPLHDKGAFGRS